MDFDIWFEEKYGKAMEGRVPAFGAAFKEVAKAAWEAGRNEAWKEVAQDTTGVWNH